MEAARRFSICLMSASAETRTSRFPDLNNLQVADLLSEYLEQNDLDRS